ncbi:MAG: toxin-antitoxin system YwqK family antitoxin [Candidatus Omnitrophica bacterium]|nr:toxin-antitoxin system YwqK family antitoxin [Candidatus Omnitrophota bacterium]
MPKIPTRNTLIIYASLVLVHMLLVPQEIILCAEKASSVHSIIKEYYLNDKIKTEISVKEGVLDGFTREYFESGIIAAERNYRNGKRDGPGRVFFENGNVQLESIYKDGKFISLKEFDDQGKALDGVVRQYYPGGVLGAETTYKNGMPDGISRTYYEDGALKTEWIYLHGKLTHEKTYNESGEVIDEKIYQK